jgi:hypothetical protein
MFTTPSTNLRPADDEGCLKTEMDEYARHLTFARIMNGTIESRHE